MPPRPSVASGSTASRVQMTNPSGDGSPLATPRVKGSVFGRTAAALGRASRMMAAGARAAVVVTSPALSKVLRLWSMRPNWRKWG